MALTEFVPLNGVEHAIAAARAGAIPMQTAMEAIVGGRLAVSSLSAVQADGGGFKPLLFNGPEDRPLVAVFTAPDRAKTVADRAGFLMEMAGGDVLARLPAGYGVIVNPGYAAQMVIPESGLAELKRAFLKR